MLRTLKIINNTNMKNISRLISTSSILKGKEYLPNEEWIERKNDYIKFGITKSAVEQMGELVYIEFEKEPEVKLTKGDEMATIESVKSAETLVVPFDCVLIENNNKLEDDLDIINLDAESNESWIVKLKEI